MPHSAEVNEALHELALRLRIPCDMIAVHREERPQGGRDRKYASLRYGAFLLSYGPLEAFFENLTNYRERKNRVLGLNPDRIRGALEEVFGIPDVPTAWAARTRVAPTGSTGNRSPWELLTGKRLHDYLADMKNLRDILSHGGDPTTVSNRSGALNPLTTGGHSIRLMGVEGFVQAVQDLASETAIAICGAQVSLPDWPSPPSTGASDAGRLPQPY